MPTSGNTVKLLTRDDIINSALRKLMVISEGVAPSTLQSTNAAEALNIIVAEFRTLGMSVWARESYLLPLVATQSVYTFGVGQAINTPYPTFIYEITYVAAPSFDTQVYLNSVASVDFALLPLGSEGIPVNYNYQPGLNVGTLRVWPTPDTSIQPGSYLHVLYQRPIEVFDTGTDNPDFPQEWGNALIYQLALSLADEYGVPDSKLSRLLSLADRHLATALSNSNEQGSIFLRPDDSLYQGY